ncbi:MAG: 4Fe-4S binding protein [Anaerolineae bacterium]|nr:4Fe-4S binding protein [Anaerolineae bacterium]
MNEHIIYVDVARCTGCGVCVEVCPTGAVRLMEGGTGYYAEIDEEKCRKCGVCVEACPVEAIVSQVEPAMEGEIVMVKAKPVPVKSQYREVRPVQPAPKALAWLGAALAFAGREIVPRVAVSLLDAWDRRASRSTPSQTASVSVRSALGPAVNSLKGTGRQHRWRRHRGGQ